MIPLMKLINLFFYESFIIISLNNQKEVTKWTLMLPNSAKKLWYHKDQLNFVFSIACFLLLLSNNLKKRSLQFSGVTKKRKKKKARLTTLRKRDFDYKRKEELRKAFWSSRLRSRFLEV